MNSVLKNMMHLARRFPTATVLNMVGLTVAFTACYLFLTQVDYHRSYNGAIPDAARVYRFEARMSRDVAWAPLCNRVVNDQIARLPQVEAMTELACWDSVKEFLVGESVVEHLSCGTNLTPFGAMGARCIDGQLSWEAYGDHSAIIPASLARKLFGRVDVAGEPLYSKTDTLTVRGVYADFPDNCSMKNYVYYATRANLDNWSEWSYMVFVKLHENTDKEAFFSNFAQQLREHLWKDQWGKALASGEAQAADEARTRKDYDRYFADYDYRFTPLGETYFSGINADEDKGNPAMLLVLELACVLTIIIATINFLNFTLAVSPMRIKSVSTRRVLGESLLRLRLGLVAESVLTVALACGVAMGLCELIATLHSDLLLGNVSLSSHPWLVASLALIAVAMGVVAGAYPAAFVTSFQPALVLKGSFGLTPRGRHLRSALVALQLGIALLLVTYICILKMQSYYIYNSDYGYAKDEVIYAQLTGELQGRKEAVRAELMGQGGVVDVAFSRFVLGAHDSYMGWGRRDDDHNITFTCMPVDHHYLRTMGISVIEGRDFNEHDGDCYIINETARQQWPWVELDKKLLKHDWPVVGVCENIRYASTRKDRQQEPLAFFIFGTHVNWGDQLGVVNIRVAAGTDKVAMRAHLGRVLTQMGSGEPVETLFLDEQLEQLYQEEFRFMRQVSWLSVICLVITLIGVFCLTMFEAEYRRKEIGLRKVMGSTTGQILLLFCRHYGLLLAVSFVVAAPMAWHFGTQWLQSFAERTPIYWWLFPLSLLVVSVVTMLTVIVQSWRTANENPVNSIKNE